VKDEFEVRRKTKRSNFLYTLINIAGVLFTLMILLLWWGRLLAPSQ
jgi:hypothetical protein